MMEEMRKLNQDRKIASQNRKVIYGPVEYTEKTYLEYTLGNLRLKLCTTLKEKELKFGDGELKEYYEKNKKTLTVSPEHTSVLVITANFSGNNAAGSTNRVARTRKDALDKMNEIKQRLDRKAGISELTDEKAEFQRHKFP